VGCGHVFPVKQDQDLARFPDGGVLVARRSSPKFVAVMNKARAIVTDEGRAAGHMATLAREFQVPAIVNARTATQVLQPGQEVTVDATHGYVYDGKVEELLRRPRARRGIFKDSPAFATLQKILPAITTLNLIDPESENFKPGTCQSFHDLTRFCHQSAMQEMYRLAEEAARSMDRACRVQSGIPLEIYVLDLGGGIEAEPTARRIEPEAITSIPMRAFWRGLTSVAWPTPRPSAGGFLSVVAHTVADPELQRRLEEKSLTILSGEYMNFSLRLGYHLSTVEGLCSSAVDDNYLRLYFHGGAASAERRLRRARLVEKIVEQRGFHVQRQGETVEAILTHCERQPFEEQMEMLGRLTVYTKQLDMAMFNDSIVEVFAEEFLRGQYGRPNQP
jgi:pyruvate,water dikinase